MGTELLLKPRFMRTYTVSSGLAAAGVVDLGITEDHKDEYGPFNIANIINLSGQPLALIPDGQTAKQMIVGNNNDKVWSDVSFNTITVKNIHATDATDATVYVTIQAEVGTREFLEQLAVILKSKIIEIQQR